MGIALWGLYGDSVCGGNRDHEQNSYWDDGKDLKFIDDYYS